jgi:hypothetical protein
MLMSPNETPNVLIDQHGMLRDDDEVHPSVPVRFKRRDFRGGFGPHPPRPPMALHFVNDEQIARFDPFMPVPDAEAFTAFVFAGQRVPRWLRHFFMGQQ